MLALVSRGAEVQEPSKPAPTRTRTAQKKVRFMPPSVSGPPENCKRFHARADRAGGETRRCGRARQAGNAEIIRRSRGYLLSRGALVFGCGPVVVVGQQHELSKQLATARSSAEKSNFFIG